MQFFYKDNQGNEIGPVDDATLLKWVSEDRLVADSMVRNAMLKSWKKAEDLNFLAAALEEQSQRIKNADDSVDKTLKKIKGTVSSVEKKVAGTAFVRKYMPQNASAAARVWAFVLDFTIFAVFASCLFGGTLYFEFRHIEESISKDKLVADDNRVMLFNILKKEYTKAARKARKRPKVKPAVQAMKELNLSFDQKGRLVGDNPAATTAPTAHADVSAGYQLGSKWLYQGKKFICLSAEKSNAVWIEKGDLSKGLTICLSIIIVFVVFYYSFLLGFFAQTFGMWFFGIFVCRRKEERELGFMHSLLFTVLMLIFGILSPLLSYLFGASIHDILCGVRVTNIAGDPV